MTRMENWTLVAGEIKWYDRVRGYGFLVPRDGGADVLVTACCVEGFGRYALARGCKLTVEAASGERGPYAQKILSLEEPALPAEDDAWRPTDVIRTASEVGPLEPARVKWFDQSKGFGFVNVFGVAEDVFVHNETAHRCGFGALERGQALAVSVVRGRRGLIVADLKPWEFSER